VGAGYRWVILASGTLSQASFACASVALPALGPALRTDYRLSLTEVGVVLAGLQIGMLLTLLPWGLLADRYDERWVITAGLAGAAVALAAAAGTRSYAGVTLVLVAAGALGASVNAASGRAVMGWFDRSELGLALGIRQTAIPIGGALGAAVLPALASSGGTRLAFFALAGACAFGAALAATFMRGAPARESDVGEVTKPLREPRLWLLAGAASLYLTAQIGITSFVVLFLHDHRHMSEHAAAAILAVINLLAIGARIASGRISDRLHTRLRPLRAIGFALALATGAVAALTDGPLGLLVAAFLVAGVLSMSWNALAFTAAAEAAGSARTGAALGFQQTMLGVVTAAAPPAIAAIASTSWRAAFVVSAVGPLAGTLLLRTLSPRDERSRGTSAIPPAAP
jgi:sugar phosphate permease